MPCNSDHMNANRLEIQCAELFRLRDELTGGPAYTRNDYDDRAYGRANLIEVRDELTRELCAKLKDCGVSQYSLELQMWWRDHQRADLKRKETEARTALDKKLARSGLAKLTNAERKALGLA